SASARSWTDDMTPRAEPREDQEEAERFSLLSEALGYVGAALVLGAGLVVLARAWRDLGTAGKLSVLGAVAIGLASAARWAEWTTGNAGRRLAAVLWTMSTGALAAFSGVVARDAMGLSDPASVVGIGLGWSAFALFLRLRRPNPLQSLTLGCGLLVLASGVIVEVGVQPLALIGFTFWFIGLGLLVQGWLGWGGEVEG